MLLSMPSSDVALWEPPCRAGTRSVKPALLLKPHIDRSADEDNRLPSMEVCFAPICFLPSVMLVMLSHVAQLYYIYALGIGKDPGDAPDGRDAGLRGLVNSAPYLCCAVLGCW